MSYMDNETIGSLMSSGLVDYNVSTFEDQHFWHGRVETLSGRRIDFAADVDWKQVYQLLQSELQSAKIRFWNEADNATVVELLVKMGYSPGSNAPSLSEACQRGLVAIVRYLLAEGSIDPNDTSLKHHYPPLSLACDEARVEVVKLLLADPRVDPNNEEGHATALMQACTVALDGRRADYIEVVRLLLEDGRADPTWHHSVFISAINFADNDEVVRLLLADGRADPSDDDSMSLVVACSEGRTKTVKLLLEDGRAQPWVDNGNALIQAVVSNEYEIVEMLLQDKRVDPNVRDGESLLISLSQNDASSNEMSKLLLADDRTYPAIRDNAAIKTAIRSDNSELVGMLLEDPDVLELLSEDDLKLADQVGNLQVIDLVRNALEGSM
ncbi:Ankyrin repeat protein [uncultured virus]|nr:Ankyrin repeat protein [uncultured virus]